MLITWDEPKRLSNIAKHGLDFAELTVDFFVSARVQAARDGRFLAIGWWHGRKIVAVIYRLLGSEAISVISMRLASAGERDQL